MNMDTRLQPKRTPRNASIFINVQMGRELKDKLEALAVKWNVSAGSIMRQAFIDYLQKWEEEAAATSGRGESK